MSRLPQEFEDPLEYIRSIQARAYDLGICRIHIYIYACMYMHIYVYIYTHINLICFVCRRSSKILWNTSALSKLAPTTSESAASIYIYICICSYKYTHINLICLVYRRSSKTLSNTFDRFKRVPTTSESAASARQPRGTLQEPSTCASRTAVPQQPMALKAGQR